MSMTFEASMRSMQRMFFDRQRIQYRVDARTRRVLSKFGAFVRQTAKRSMPYRKKRVSPPGRPPYSHTKLLKRNIFFGYNESRRSVVIGPIRRASKVNSRRVLPALEYGGRTDLIGGGKKTIQARPFMQPAFESELLGLGDMWADSIR